MTNQRKAHVRAGTRARYTATRPQQRTKYTTRTARARSAWRPMAQPRGFDATRRRFDADMRSTGRALAAAWWVAVVVTVVGMAMFGWGC